MTRKYKDREHLIETALERIRQMTEPRCKLPVIKETSVYDPVLAIGIGTCGEPMKVAFLFNKHNDSPRHLCKGCYYPVGWICRVGHFTPKP